MPPSESPPDLLAQAEACQRAGDLAGAESRYREWLRRAPDDARALCALGQLCHLQGRDTEALPLLRRSVELQPAAAPAHAALAAVLFACGEPVAAVEAGQRALALEPVNPLLLNFLGYVLHRLGRWPAAVGCFRRALDLKPELADAYHNLGISLQVLGHTEEAVRNYRRALRITPGVPALNSNLGVALTTLGRYEEALESHERALELDPECLEARYRRLFMRRFLCHWDRLEEDSAALQEALAAHARDRGAALIAPFEMMALGLAPEVRLAVTRRYAEQVAGGLPEGGALPPAPVKPPSRLRVGYVSPDFREHAVGLLVHQLFSHHDRERVEVYGYALRPSDDRYARAIRAGCDTFLDVTSLSPLEAARRMRADALDVLVDLGGYTHGARPEILALRPAPVQMSWLGYLETMAADFVDYLIADEVVIPATHESHYSEAIIRLQGCFLGASQLPRSPKRFSRRELGLPEDAFVFCSFNNPYKIEPQVFDAWMEILRRAPGSVMWLYVADLAPAEANLRQRARAQGLEDRLIFAPTVPLAEHLARLEHADLFLDTWCYNAGATAVAALQAGVPVLTRLGETFVSRVGASVNSSLGLQALVCGDAEAYTAQAVELATDRERHAELCRQLPAALAATHLLSPAAAAARLEAAYQAAWERFQQGLPPAAIVLE